MEKLSLERFLSFLLFFFYFFFPFNFVYFVFFFFFFFSYFFFSNMLRWHLVQPITAFEFSLFRSSFSLLQWYPNPPFVDHFQTHSLTIWHPFDIRLFSPLSINISTCSFVTYSNHIGTKSGNTFFHLLYIGFFSFLFQKLRQYEILTILRDLEKWKSLLIVNKSQLYDMRFNGVSKANIWKVYSEEKIVVFFLHYTIV